MSARSWLVGKNPPAPCGPFQTLFNGPNKCKTKNMIFLGGPIGSPLLLLVSAFGGEIHILHHGVHPDQNLLLVKYATRYKFHWNLWLGPANGQIPSRPRQYMISIECAPKRHAKKHGMIYWVRPSPEDKHISFYFCVFRYLLMLWSQLFLLLLVKTRRL